MPRPRLLFALLFAGGLYAHPMGNFSVSHYSRLQLERDGVKLTYIRYQAQSPACGNWSANVAITAGNTPVSFRDKKTCRSACGPSLA